MHGSYYLVQGALAWSLSIEWLRRLFDTKTCRSSEAVSEAEFIMPYTVLEFYWKKELIVTAKIGLSSLFLS
jgi:hypothetical protein